ncbi:MAG: zinc-binding dehydrogenase [Deltaproteobacteria bacterium]|nr:zinc-binding dehydrogenase [Deltaproteobacteria bacterium]MBI4223964.1 zinc-binding dehydrogenase [Deltaproteobacteria bacterium]
MKTKAAVLIQTREPLAVVDLGIPPLKEGQVLVEVAYSGVCHTQLLECRGYRGEDKFLPHCLGHEASGVVREIGPGVTKVRPEQKVILSWMKGSGKNVPGTTYDWNGTAVNAGAVTTFSRSTVVSENRLTPVADDFDLKSAALLGCAAATGLGSVLNVAQPKAGQSLAVFGAGGIGLCAVAGARIAGCRPVIAIDLLEERLALAKAMGATECRLAGKEGAKLEGLDFAVEATGVPEVMLQAVECVRPQGGTIVIVGNARHGQRLQLDPFHFNLGKRLLGTWGGDNDPDRDFPKYAGWVSSGALNLRPLISKCYPLAEINRALDDLETGRAARPLIDMSL